MRIHKNNIEDQAPFVSLVNFRNEMGVSDVTAWRWRKRGILATVNIGGRQYVSHEEIKRFKERAEAGEFAVESTVPLAKGKPVKDNSKSAAGIDIKEGGNCEK